MNFILAIDPGKSGGLAWKFPNGDVSCQKMPQTIGDFSDFISELCLKCKTENWPMLAVVEDLPLFMGNKLPGSRIAILFKNYGMILGVFQALKIRTILTRPQEWQKSVGAGISKGKTKTQWKNHLKSIAQRLFPDQSITLCTSDALLILEYAKLCK